MGRLQTTILQKMAAIISGISFLMICHFSIHTEAQTSLTDKIPRKALCSTGEFAHFPATFGIETDSSNRNEVLTS